VVGVRRGIGIFCFFYDVMRISATTVSFVNDICIHGSLVLSCGTWVPSQKCFV